MNASEVVGWKLSANGNYYKEFGKCKAIIGYSHKDNKYYTMLVFPANVRKYLDLQVTAEAAMEKAERFL